MVKESINNSLYDKLPSLVLGFHGCSNTTYQQILYEHNHLKKSENSYDWLGNGIYFWENGYERALEWAEIRYGEDAKVIGAAIDLGYCLNLTDIRSTKILNLAYKYLEARCKAVGEPVPQNEKGRSETDILLRNLDCAVIQQLHDYNSESGRKSYDSVRGVFIEGKPAFPGAAISEKTHIQICVINPNCIKGYFAPIEPMDEYRIP